MKDLKNGPSIFRLNHTWHFDYKLETIKNDLVLQDYGLLWGGLDNKLVEAYLYLLV